MVRLALAICRPLAVGLTGTLGLLVASACGSGGSPVGRGGECFLATDCAPGLVCIEQANKTRVCSDDLSDVTGRRPESRQEEAGADEGGAIPDGEVPDTRTPVPDTGAPDTNPPPPDTGAPPDDSGTDA